MAPDDWRRHGPEFQEPNLSRNLALRDALGTDRPAARRHDLECGGRVDARMAGCDGGDRRRAHAGTGERLDRRRTLELTAADLDEIAAAIARMGAGTGPTRPAASGVTGRR